MGINLYGDGFAWNEFAAIRDRIDAKSGHEHERGVNLLAFMANAAGKRLDRRGSLARERRQRNLIELFARSDQRIGGGFVIEAQCSIASSNQRSVHRTHQWIDTFVSDLKVFIERTERLVERGGIGTTALFTRERDWGAQERSVLKTGGGFAVMGLESLATAL